MEALLGNQVLQMLHVFVDVDVWRCLWISIFALLEFCQRVGGLQKQLRLGCEGGFGSHTYCNPIATVQQLMGNVPATPRVPVLNRRSWVGN